jgi:hypothetical protein
MKLIRTGLVAAVAIATVTATAGAASAAPEPDRPGVVRDGNLWQLRDALSGGSPSVQFRYGNPEDFYRVTGDWDGNGSRTPGVVRIAAGGRLVWYLRNSTSAGGASLTFAYGVVGDTPIAGDWDGDGKDTPGVVRPQGTGFQPVWLLRNSTTAGGAYLSFVWGSPNGFIPVPGDWDGNGTDTPGEVIYPDGVGQIRWLTRDSNTFGSPNRDFYYGSSADSPVVGDWDGDGADGVGVVKAQGSQLLWRLRQTPTYGQPQYTFLYGAATSAPVVWT